MEGTIKNKNLWVKWLITLAVPVSFACIPLSQDYTRELMIFFAITAFIISIVAFDLVDLMAASILLPTLYFLSGVAPMGQAFGAWTNTTIWMILGALILANALDECGLLRRIALGCIVRCGGTYTGTLYGVFLAGVAISFVTFSQAFIIMITLTYGICRAMELDRSIRGSLMCFVGMLGGITTCTFMYNPGYLALGEAGIRAIEPGFTVQWYDSLLYNGLYFFLFLGLIWLLTRIYNTREITFSGGAKYFHEELAKLGPMTVKEKKGLFIVGLLMIYLFSSPFHGLPAAYGFMTFTYLLFFPGINVATSECIKKTNFSVIFFIAGCLGIGIVASYLHAEQLISKLVAPVLQGSSPLVALLLMLSLGAICNLFLTPYAMMAALSLPFATLAIDLGFSPLTSIMTLMISTDIVFLPHEVAGCLLMYSFGLIPMGNFVKLYTLKAILTYIFFIVAIYPLWRLCGFIAG